METQNNQNKTLIIAAIVLVLILAFLVWKYMPATTPSKEQTNMTPIVPKPQPAQLGDATPYIFNDLQAVNVNDLDGEFKDIDTDLNSL
jgi:hypothetical protein